MKGWAGLLFVLAAFAGAMPAHASPSRKPLPTDPCVAAAAQYHRVNASVLAAILRVEGMGETQVVANRNGSIDVGRAGINSIHFDELARWGVSPQDLLDGCKNVFVSAWLLSRHLSRHGNTWEAYASYHSRTPHLNHRYQILIVNELIAMGILKGKPMPVPPLR